MIGLLDWLWLTSAVSVGVFVGVAALWCAGTLVSYITDKG